MDSTLFADQIIYKPYKCGNSACVCLYSDEWEPGNAAKRDSGIISCSTFPGKNILFSSSVGSGTSKDDGTKYLIFYGKKGSQPIYIEKKYDKGSDTYNIYISNIDSNDPNNPALLRRSAIESLER